VTTTELRCPECGSLVRAGVSWCSLCHADLRSDEEKEAARLEAEKLAGAGISVPGALVVDSPAEQVRAGAPTRGRHARPSTSPTATLEHPAPRTAPAAAAESGELTATAPVPEAETEQKLAELQQAGIDVDGMLEMLASSTSADPLHGLVDRISSKGSRAIAVIIASTALTAIGLGLMFVLGWIFG
jgi:hypothetical protein